MVDKWTWHCTFCITARHLLKSIKTNYCWLELWPLWFLQLEEKFDEPILKDIIVKPTRLRTGISCIWKSSLNPTLVNIECPVNDINVEPVLLLSHRTLGLCKTCCYWGFSLNILFPVSLDTSFDQDPHWGLSHHSWKHSQVVQLLVH